MTDRWIKIRYRDFYDVPRAVVVEWRRQTWLFDCLYNYDIEDYANEYIVYRLPDDVAERIDSMSWTDLGHLGVRVGAIPVARVAFDPTKREALHANVFDELGLP